MSFNIIHQKGRATEATTLKGQRVERQESFFIMDYRAMVKAAPYDEHFIYETTEIGPAHKCTCGSAAVVVPPGPKGMMVCLHHATYGFHTTSMVNKKDIERGAVKIMKGQKWA